MKTTEVRPVLAGVKARSGERWQRAEEAVEALWTFPAAGWRLVGVALYAQTIWFDAPPSGGTLGRNKRSRQGFEEGREQHN